MYPMGSDQFYIEFSGLLRLQPRQYKKQTMIYSTGKFLPSNLVIHIFACHEWLRMTSDYITPSAFNYINNK